MTSTVKTMPLSEVNVNALENLKTHADELNSTAMQLTGAWGSVMFVLDPPIVSKTFETLGFSRDVSQEVYEKVRSIYAVNKFGTTDSSINLIPRQECYDQVQVDELYSFVQTKKKKFGFYTLTVHKRKKYYP